MHRAQAADVVLEIWPSMVPDSQAFGDTFPASARAVECIVQVIEMDEGD